MAKYRKKPVVIEAVLVESPEAAFEVLIALGAKSIELSHTPPGLLIETVDGTARADVGDWVIRGVEGEFYPCKASVFAKTYEEVE